MSHHDEMGNSLKPERKEVAEIFGAIDEILKPGAKLDDVDAGALAREKIQIRDGKVKQVLVKTYLSFMTLVILVIAAVVWFAYAEYQKPGKRIVDYRPCIAVNESQNMEVTGRREFSYLQKSLFGFEYREAGDVTEATQIDVSGSSMTIVGLHDGGWWSTYVGEGEQGVQILKDASLYVITSGKKSMVIDYEEFCR